MGEHCQICGREYDYVYSIPNKLWEKFTGIKNRSGLRCIPCLDIEAREKGVYLQWKGRNDGNKKD